MFARTSFWAVLFVVASGLDLLLTRLLLTDREIGYEANPLAASILQHYGWWGLSAFKALAVVFVTAIGLAIHLKYPRSALRMFRISSVLVLCVLAYSVALLGSLNDPEGFNYLSEARRRSQVIERKCEDFNRFMKNLDELARGLIARNVSLVEATAALQETLENSDFDPLPGLRIECGEDASAEVCLAAHLVRSVGFLVHNDPGVREETRARLADEFDLFEMPLPEYSAEAFDADPDLGENIR